jgi:hypothetical protein
MHCYRATCFWVSMLRSFQVRSRRGSNDEGTGSGVLFTLQFVEWETSHVPTHGQISAPSSLRWSDGRRRSGMTFKCNLRAIIFKSRPLPPPPTLIIQATADEVPLVTYCCLQSGAKHLRDESTIRWPAYRRPSHYHISQTRKLLTQYKTKVKFYYTGVSTKRA